MASSSSPQQTLSTALMACLGQEDITDMHLLGKDGVKVPAFRTILACRSEVFRRMLYGTFEESASDVVSLDYNGKVLGAVVEFCITDDIRRFDGRDNETAAREIDGCDNETAAREIVQLIACAHFLNMPLLQDMARKLTNNLLGTHKSLACIVYDEASLYGEPTESVKYDALAIIRKFPDDTLLSESAIVSLKPDSLGALIGDDGMECEEITLFHALNEWATSQNVGESFSFGPNDRVSIAKDLAARHIHLSSIRPSHLVGIVRKSCLVDETKLSEVLENQALLADESMMQFSKKRKQPSGVTVSGAGADAVNGFYEKDGEHGGFPKYTKKCSWKGETRTLCVYRYMGGEWCIALVRKDGRIDLDSSDNDFYEGDDQDSVPIDGWIKVPPLGLKPCPEVRQRS